MPRPAPLAVLQAVPAAAANPPSLARATATAATLALLAFAPAAHAHAVLVASEPTVGGSLPAGAATITLHYNSRVDRGRSTMTLTGADRGTRRLPVDPSGPTDQLSAAATLDPGAYTVRWQVLATDGHITRGDVAFTVGTGPADAPGTPTNPTPAPTAATATTTATPAARSAGN